MQGGDSPNIQPYSWIYYYLRELKLRGYFEELNLNLLPVKRDDISSNLNSYKQSSGGAFKNYSLSILRNELNTSTISSKNTFEPFKTGLLATSSYEISDQSPVKSINIRTKFLLEMGSDLQFYNSMLFDNRLDEDQGYLGRSWRSLEGFTEQG